MDELYKMIANREIDTFNMDWAEATKMAPPHELLIAELLQIYSAHDLGEALMGLMRQLKDREIKDSDQMLQYLEAYALVYFCIGGL